MMLVAWSASGQLITKLPQVGTCSDMTLPSASMNISRNQPAFIRTPEKEPHKSVKNDNLYYQTFELLHHPVSIYDIDPAKHVNA